MSNLSDMPARRVIPIKPHHDTALNPAQQAAVDAACAQYRGVPGSLLPILHAVQAELNFVPPPAVPAIARQLNLSVAEVHGVISFYHYFRTHPVGRHVVHLCRAEACQAVGGVALETHAKRVLGVDYHGTASDGAVSLEPVYCLGNCALGPALMIDGKLEGRVSTQRFDALVAACRTAPETTS